MSDVSDEKTPRVGEIWEYPGNRVTGKVVYVSDHGHVVVEYTDRNGVVMVETWDMGAFTFYWIKPGKVMIDTWFRAYPSSVGMGYSTREVALEQFNVNLRGIYHLVHLDGREPTITYEPVGE